MPGGTTLCPVCNGKCLCVVCEGRMEIFIEPKKKEWVALPGMQWPIRTSTIAFAAFAKTAKASGLSINLNPIEGATRPVGRVAPADQSTTETDATSS